MRATVLAAFGCALLLGCTSDTTTAPETTEVVLADHARHAPQGSPFAETAEVYLALYGLPGTSFEPEPVFTRLLSERLPTLPRVDGELTDIEGARVHVIAPPIDQYPPPPAEAVPYFSIGLSEAQMAALPSADRVFTTAWVLPVGERGQSPLLTVMDLWGDLAEATGGIPWDDDTRQAMSVEAWNELRLTEWQDGTPPVDKHMTMHMYEDQGAVRLVTLGMAKLGLPDLSIPAVIRNDSAVMGTLINATAQAMLEGATVGPDGALNVDLAALKNQGLREAAQAHVIEGSGEATLTLTVAKPREGDAENRQWEISFPGSGDAYHQAQIALLEGMFGSGDDGVTTMEHDDELLAASERSRQELFAMRDQLQGKLGEAGALLVKGPFPTTSGGNEWMWVEVRSWERGIFEGLLINEPIEIPDLKYGMTVQVSEADMFDYRLDKPDGSTMGWHATRLQAAREGIEIE